MPSASSPPIVTDVALASATLSSVAPASSVSPAGAAADKVYDQTTTAITATVGDNFFVVVPGNATTSFAWRADPKPDESVLSVGRSIPKYTPQPPPGCDAGCVGYGGTYAFGVTANAAGTAKLQLVKVHIGRAPGTPVQQVSIVVTVK